MRVRGRKFEEGGKFHAEVSIWTMDGEGQIDCWVIGPFGNIELADKAMMDAVRIVCDKIQEEADGQVSGTYLDMKNGGILRKWGDQN